MELKQQRQRGFHCEMDATFNGLESEANGGVGVSGGGVQQQMLRKGRGGTNGIQNHPIIFKSK